MGKSFGVSIKVFQFYSIFNAIFTSAVGNEKYAVFSPYKFLCSSTRRIGDTAQSYDGLEIDQNNALTFVGL